MLCPHPHPYRREISSQHYEHLYRLYVIETYESPVSRDTFCKDAVLLAPLKCVQDASLSTATIAQDFNLSVRCADVARPVLSPVLSPSSFHLA